MAQILPAIPEAPEYSACSPAEWLTLKKLEEGLPEDWMVFNNIFWTQVSSEGRAVGEMDFCILSPTGKLLIIEQKNGELLEKPDGLYKQYPTGEKSVGTQIQRTLNGLHTKFKRMHPHGGLWADYLIYLPDYQLKALNAIALDSERIIDARRSAQLCAILIKIERDTETLMPDRHEKTKAFLLDSFSLVRDVHAYGRLQSEMYVRISGGLASWVDRLAFEPFHLRIRGTAGSGKTQLAIKELNDTVAAGKKALLLCFNHALARRLAAMAPDGAVVSTFHHHCENLLLDAGVSIDFERENAYEAMVAAAAKLPMPESFRVDTLIIDEGQDLQQAWLDQVMRLVAPAGRVIWIEDPHQQLRDAEPIKLPGFVNLTVPTNYRSPRKIQQAIELLLKLGTESGNPFPGLDPQLHTYDSIPSLFQQVRARLEDLIKQGFSTANIALISYRGLNHSVFSNLDQVGNTTLMRYTGSYDESGRQIDQDGDLLFDTLYRYKGRQAQVILLVEIDFDELDTINRNKLYCGMTRATLHLECFFSHRAAEILSKQIAMG